jgi:hypothetical protein
LILTSVRSKSFDLYYPEVGILNQTTFEPSVELQAVSVMNSGIFKPYSKSKFRFARNDFVSMDINQYAASYFNNQIMIDVTLDYQAFKY